ncbi:MAG: hypothetical protein H6677_19670 [Candidatus Obscuribacterales bacterium]|nr:hypothetical protein [Candidatus Obscuribacterales bacterium]
MATYQLQHQIQHSISPRTRVLAALFCLLTMLSGCGRAEKQSIKTTLDVKVTDPNLRKLTECTARAVVDARGAFKPGTYFFNGAPIIIPENTTFSLKLETPITDPAVISTKDAVGTFRTSNQIIVGAIPVPEELSLQSGKVEAYVDFARSLSAFMINLVQLGGGSTGGMKEMIDSLELKEVDLELRPDSRFKLGKKSLHIGKGSSIKLFDAKLDSSFNYDGQFIAKLNFLNDCDWLGDKLDCEFEGGTAKVHLNARKKNGVLTLSLPKEGAECREVNMESCILRFGKNKRSQTVSKKAVLSLNKFVWEDTTKTHPTMSMDADMDLFDTDASIKTDIHHTKAHFAEEVPGRLIVKIDKSDSRYTNFVTTAPVTAREGTVTIDKTNSKVVLKLSEVSIGKVVYDKEGAMEFSLKGGIAEIEEVAWEGQGKHFVLQCGKGSTLQVPNEFLIEKQTQKGAAKVQMPMALNLGKAKLKSGENSVQLEDLVGKIILDVDKEVLIRGSLDFSLPEVDLLSGYKARVKARGIDMVVKGGTAKILLRDCTVLIPDQALEATIKERIPKEFHVVLNKKIQEEKKWRYRNAMVKEVFIKNFDIKKMATEPSDVVGFTASGEVSSNGTIEKSGIILNKNKWETKPWSMSGHVEGKGQVKYKFLKRNKSKNARLTYDLDMKVTMPDDVKLDWSKVSGGIIKIAEERAIIKRLNTVAVPVEHSGELTIFKKDAPFWRNFVISDMKEKDLPGSTQIDFQVETRM